MARKPKFVLPSGLGLDTKGSLNVEFDGDVVIEDTLGLPIGQIIAGGNLDLQVPAAGVLMSAGKLTVTADVDADRLEAKDIEITGKSVRARAIVAGRKVVIGPARLTVDVIKAPEVLLDENATGRVTVIDCNNDWGPSKIKGGLSIDDYEEIIGDAAAFLAQRGVGEGMAPMPASEGDTLIEAPIEAPLEDDEDPESLAVEDLEPVDDDPHKNATRPRLQQQLQKELARITACYEGSDVPPAIEQLSEMVETADYMRLRSSITEVWNGLLGFHQQRGIRPHHQVTHAFNKIHGLVQEV